MPTRDGDVNSRGDRSIRNIPVSTAHRRTRLSRAQPAREEEMIERAPRLPRRRRSSRLFIIVGIFIALICGAAGILLSTLFAGASVTVYPRVADIPTTLSVSAQPNAPAGTLPYQTMTITVSGTTSVPASGSQKVSRQASGVITITNAYSAESQRLIANTRFEAPDGKIYRIHDSVVVPGMNGTTPGTATATVYADAAGEAYNRSTTHFTIPGFKNDPRYSKFYADTSSISGGFVGNEPAVAAADLDAAKTTMAQKLSEAAHQSLTAQIPDGFVLVENASQSTYSDMRQTPDGADQASLSQSITMTQAIVRASDVAAYAASKSVAGYDGAAVNFTTLDTLRVEAAANTSPVGKIDLNVSGVSQVMWQYDSNAIISALLGKNKNQFESVINSFKPALTGAEVVLRPFWKSDFPSDPGKIKVVEGTKK